MTPLSDLELTRLCALAMRFEPYEANGRIELRRCDRVEKFSAKYSYFVYDPLHDDAQCFALVKRFGLRLRKNGPEWCAWLPHYGSPAHLAADLNRAIVQCCAQLYKEGKK